MTDLTPRNTFPYPSEREEPFFDSFKAGQLAIDAAVFANSDNCNLQFMEGGLFSWDAANDLIFWTETIRVNGFHGPFAGFIPSGSAIIQQNEVLYFQMPRLVQNADVELQLFRSNRLFIEGVRLHDLILFVTRKGDTLYFYNGLSLQDGDTGILFGQGLEPKQTTIPHEHEPPFKYIAPGAGITQITPTPIILQPDLARADVFKNGQLLVDGDDYTYSFVTGIITLTSPTVVVPNADKFIVWREIRDTTVTVTSHEHGPKLVFAPIPGTTVLNALATAPILQRVDVFKNGQLLVEGAGEDFTADLVTGLITLVVPSAVNDKYEIQRELGIP